MPAKAPVRASEVLLSAPAPELNHLLTLTPKEIEDRVFSRVVELAIRNDAFRRRVAAKMRNLGEGMPKRATSAFDIQQVATVVELMTLNYKGTRKEHKLKTPRLFHEVAAFLEITEAQARKRYYRAKALGLFPM